MLWLDLSNIFDAFPIFYEVIGAVKKGLHNFLRLHMWILKEIIFSPGVSHLIACGGL